MAKKAVAGEVKAHWSTLVENLRISPQGFYEAVAGAIQRREIPDATTSTVVWSEAGALSARREYFRVTRGRLVFDICAAPFGKGFFFSWWLAEARPSLRFLYGAILGGVIVLTLSDRLSMAFQNLNGFLWPLALLSILVLASRAWRSAQSGPARPTVDLAAAAVGLVSYVWFCLRASLFRGSEWFLPVVALLALAGLCARAWLRRGSQAPSDPSADRALSLVALVAFVVAPLVPVSRWTLRALEFYGALAGLALVVGCVVGWLRQEDKPSFRDLLVGVPVLGRLFAPETYYKVDTTNMFRLAAQQAVHEAIEKFTTAQGIRALTELERKPIMRDFLGP